MCQEDRAAPPLIPRTDRQERLRLNYGSACEACLRLFFFVRGVDARAFEDVSYGDEEQCGAHALTLKYVVM